MRNTRHIAATVAMLILGTVAYLVTPVGPALAAVPGGMVQVAAVSPFNANQSKSITVFCPAGDVVIGTGSSIFNGGGQVAIEAVVPDIGLTSVTVTAKAADVYNVNWEVTAYAHCVPPLPGQVRVMVTNLSSSISPQVVVANCPAGTAATGIGYDIGNGFGEVLINQVVLNGGAGVPADQVTVTAHEDGVYVPNWTLTVYMICANPLPGQEVVTATTAAGLSPAFQAVNATCAAGLDMTGGSAAVNAVSAADLSELSIDSSLPFAFGGAANINNNQAIAYEEDAIGGDWTVTSYAICA
jgi:hypothetical protein